MCYNKDRIEVIMCDIYLIRHGFTPANNASYNGQEKLSEIANIRDMPLEITYGRVQAIEVGKYLQRITGKNLIYVSPYKRTMETMELALSQVNFDYKIIINNDLREIDSGVHYARTVNELLKEYPEAKEVLDKLNDDPDNTRYLNGESQIDVKNRLQNISKEIKNISESNKYANIIIFAHGTVNKWLIYLLTGKNLDHTLKNGEIIKISNDVVESVFLPNAYVPLGYRVDIEKYKELVRKNKNLDNI